MLYASMSNIFLFVLVHLSYSLISAKRTPWIKDDRPSIWKGASDKYQDRATRPLGDPAIQCMRKKFSKANPDGDP